MHAVTPRLVNCPICGKQAPFDATNPYRPFCSERCKLIDLGDWAEENYRVPDKEAPLPDQDRDPTT